MYKLNIERLQECRMKLGISKQEAAKRINVSQPTYLRYERGQRNPSIQVITRIATEFDTSVDYLIGVSDFNTPDAYLISKAKNPELFDFISTYNSLDDNFQKRLLTYLFKLIEENN